MNNSQPRKTQTLLSTPQGQAKRLLFSAKHLIRPAWSMGILAAVICSGCGDVGTGKEPVVLNSNVVTESAGSAPQTGTASAAIAEQTSELTAPTTQEKSHGIMGKAGRLLDGVKDASGQQVAETGQWLKGAWDGASDTADNAVEGSLDWANQTFKTLKDQGLTTASSTGQWLSDDWKNMESWQYKVLATDSVPAEQLEKKLNELGRQGWDCFSVDERRMIFKKRSESYLRRLPFKDILRLAPLLKQANP